MFNIAAGTYAESVVVKMSAHLKGANVDTTIITGGLKLDEDFSYFTFVTIEALTLKGSVAGKNAVVQL